ncbi:hypothetical protein C8T65DRAFT_643659 [Cerioporus squamosus]|nr:hypothetical protein C8T65DRAFT_643659 [Cerioporus squamosus]
MHKVLHLPELLLQICAFADNRTLAVLARSCGSFHECAIQVLWSDLRSLVPLVRCFPSDVWKEEGGELTFAKLPGPRDWSRVMHYSQHVRSLGSWNTTSPRMHQQVVWTIAALKPAILLPNLRRFTWTIRLGIPGECVPALMTLFSADVRRLTLYCLPYLPNVLPTILSYIADKFLSLESLEIDLAFSGTSAPELSLLSIAHSLTRMSCRHDITFNHDFFNLLSRLPNLRYLNCMLPDIPDFSSLARDSVSPPFPALQDLCITVAPHSYSEFSKIVRLHSVHTAWLLLSRVVAVHQLPLLFSAIRTQFSPSALTTLTISNADRTGTERLTVVPAHISPLLDFRRLIRLDLKVNWELRLDDQACADMAHAWPRIQYLKLASANPSADNVHSLPTLAGLVPFAIHCPHLEDLCIQFSALDIQHTTSLPRRSERPSLQYLDVECCPISHPDRVAAFLARTFPELTSLSMEDSEDTRNRPEWTKDWEEVERYLPHFASIREDERQWVTGERASEAEVRKIQPPVGQQ